MNVKHTYAESCFLICVVGCRKQDIQCVLTGWALFTNRKWRKVSFFSLDGASEAKFLYDIFHGTFLLSHHTIHH